MGFVAPGFLVALVLSGIPVLFHLLARRPARVLPFGPVELVLRAEARVRRRLRIRDASLLAARVLAIGLVVLALARPFLRVRAFGVAGLAGAEALVIVFDDSMSLRLRGDTPFERARRAALASLDALGAGDTSAVVFAGRPPRGKPARPTFDLAAVRRTLEGAAPSDRGTDLQAALGVARRMLRASSLPSRRVVVVTDLQKTGWPGGFAAVIPDDLQLDVIDVGEGAENLAVVAVGVEPAPQLGSGFARVTATIANSSRRSRRVSVSLGIDGEALAQGPIDVPANGTSRKVFHHRLPVPGGRVHAGEVRISADDLPDDDVRAFLLAGPRPIRTLVVDGDPRPSTREDEAFYLLRALAPGGADDVVPVVADVSGARDQRLDDFDAVLLCNVASLPQGVVAGLQTYVERGGGLLFAAGDRVRPAVWNRTFSALLPARIRGIRADPEGAHLEPPDARHPLLSPFPPGSSGLANAAFARHLTVEADPDLARATVVRFASGDPLLIERTVGAGRALLFTSTLDADWTDLPLRTGYLPLIQQSVRWLAGRGGAGASAPRRVGDVVALPLPAGTTRAVVRRPDGERRALDLAGRTATFTATDRPGLHRVWTEAPAGGLREDPSLAFVVGIDPAESDLRRWAHPPVRDTRTSSDAPGAKRRAPLWPALLAVLLFVLFAESGLRAWRPRG